MPADQAELTKKVISLLDLTSLNESDDAAAITTLCSNAIANDQAVAAVCVYPAFVAQAVAALRDHPVKVATVANFPHGKDTLDSVLKSIQSSLDAGAEEVDVVFPYVDYLAGAKEEAAVLIKACKKLCDHRILKVILETGALHKASSIADASEIALEAGADFLKTSTGKIAVNATLEAAAVMLAVIKQQSTRHAGLKISGGIRSIEQAAQYITLAETLMGLDWVTPAHFRIGTSRLLS